MNANLTITPTGGRELGRCYYEMTYTVASYQKLTPEKLTTLRDLGFLGYGQGFSHKYYHAEGQPLPHRYDVTSTCDSSD